MKTEPASLPSALPSADMLLSDEVVFRHKSPDGHDVQTRVPLAVGLLYAANAMRSGDSFALGYPDDRIGRLARREGGQVSMDKDVVDTVDGMAKFLDGYTEVLVAQLQPTPESAREGADHPAAAEGLASPAAAGAELQASAANFSVLAG